MADSFQQYAKTMAALVAPAQAEAPSAEAVAARRELVRMAKGRAGLA